MSKYVIRDDYEENETSKRLIYFGFDFTNVDWNKFSEMIKEPISLMCSQSLDSWFPDSKDYKKEGDTKEKEQSP